MTTVPFSSAIGTTQFWRAVCSVTSAAISGLNSTASTGLEGRSS